MKKNDIYKKEVLNAFQKVSPSKVGIENKQVFQKYLNNHINLFNNLNFPTELFRDKKILDFGCGTGEVDIIVAFFGGNVKGFDFNQKSISRANQLKEFFKLDKSLSFSCEDIDCFEFSKGAYDIAMSHGVIAHVPKQEKMFSKMSNSIREGGFVILGYIEEAGLFQRLLHREIIYCNNEKSDKEIMRIAKDFFSEHIERSVKYGGRTAASVINDYLVNPHYDGISFEKLNAWAEKYGLSFYSSSPNLKIPFQVNSAFALPMSNNSKAHRIFSSFLYLRWIYSQNNDDDVFNKLVEEIPDISEDLKSIINQLNLILQERKFDKNSIHNLNNKFNQVENNIKLIFSGLSNKLISDIENHNKSLQNIINLIIKKSLEKKEFNKSDLSENLFKGTNGLGTSYVIFRKNSIYDSDSINRFFPN